MVSVAVTVVNALGMHARAAGRFVTAASGFTSRVWLRKGGKRVDARSIMEILTLAAAKGEALVIEAEGPDEAAAAETLAALVREGFGEEKLLV